MSTNGPKHVKQTQEVNRSKSAAGRGPAGTQLKVVQQLAGVRRERFDQAMEATRNQMQLIGQEREPHEVASTQAHLVRQYGQRYVDSVNKYVDIVSEALEEYGDQLNKGKNAMDEDERATRPTAH